MRISFVLGFFLLLQPALSLPDGPIFHLHLTGVINPIKARYMENAMQRAKDEGARLVIISINTPGGLVDSTEKIIGLMVNSPVPVVTFVEPQAAMATSAGTFIVQAGDVAAMVPGTTIGSAHPVGGQGEKIEGPMEEKIVNVLVSQSRSLAERRNRNVHFAEQAVKSSMNLTAEAAKETKVIEILAGDFQDLLGKLDGYYIDHENRHDTITTAGAAIVELPLSRTEEFLDAIANPSVAYILMTLGVMGLIYEFGSPGVGLGAIVGSICLILGLLSLSALPIHLGGILLLLLGLVMLVLELKIQSHGLLTIGGATALVLGSFVLVDAGKYYGAVQQIKFGVVLPLIVAIVGTMFFFLALTARALGSPQRMGMPSLVGMTGTAKTDIEEEGMAFIDGALWQVRSESGRIDKGVSVRVTKVQDNPDRLVVEPNRDDKVAS
ncbi:MAG: nodulation protein NfeD [Candidatus Hydrogenedentota bacterium]